MRAVGAEGHVLGSITDEDRGRDGVGRIDHRHRVTVAVRDVHGAVEADNDVGRAATDVDRGYHGVVVPRLDHRHVGAAEVGNVDVGAVAAHGETYRLVAHRDRVARPCTRRVSITDTVSLSKFVT